jgi:hypothetical protein
MAAEIIVQSIIPMAEFAQALAQHMAQHAASGLSAELAEAVSSFTAEPSACDESYRPLYQCPAWQ